jgi:predicted ATPase
MVRQLMLALHLGGQTAKALDVAQRTRTRLAEELGIDPGTELQQLTLAILRNDPALTAHHESDRPVTAAPISLSTVPASRTRLIGRDQQVAEIAERFTVAGARLVTLTGPGGVGKTRLALAVAQALATHFDDGVALVSLAPIRDPADVLAAIADSLGVRDIGGASLGDALRNYLRGRDLLLVVDNVEHVLAAGPDVVGMLDAAPGLAVLATSRSPLNVRGEHLSPIEPLTDDAAAELFVERTTQAGTREDLDPSVVRTICRHLDRLPLAIELAAARTRVLPAAQLADQLDQVDRSGRRLDLPGPRDLPDRQRTLRAAIAWSYELLSAGEQALLRAVAVFAGGWTLDAAAVVAGLDPAVTVDLHAGLLDASLIVRRAQDGEARYDLLETVRVFALTEAEKTGAAQEYRARHCSYLETLIDKARVELEGPNQAEWLTRLTREQDNLRLAMRWALDHGELERFTEFTFAWRFWILLGHFSECRRWTAEAFAAGVAMSNTARARLLTLSGFVSFSQDPDAALRMSDEAVELGRRQDDLATRELALGARADMARWVGDLDGAEAMYQEAIAIAKEHGAVFTLASHRVNMAGITIERGHYAKASLELAEIETELRAYGASSGLSAALTYHGNALIELGDWNGAEALLTEAIVTRMPVGDIFILMYAMQRLAVVMALCGRVERSAVLFGAAATLVDQLGVAHLGSYARTGEQAVGKVIAELGQDRYDVLFDEGRRMAPAELLALVTQAGR